jgi:hypothetical protein
MVHPLAGKTTATLLFMSAVLVLPYASPRLRALRVVKTPWDGAPSVEQPSDAPPEPATSASVGQQTLAASRNEGTVTNSLPSDKEADEAPIDPAVAARLAGSLAIEDPTGHAMDAFYASLQRTDRKEAGAVTHILHYGDSVIASDFISGTARRRMQERFGDSGHGFILLANAWQWYFHNDVTHYNSDGWTASKLAGPITDDGMYGLGGVSFQSFGGGLAYFGTAAKGDYGRKVSRFDIYYLTQPNGGALEIKVKDGATERLDTRAPTKESKVHSVVVPDGEASISLRAAGNVRAFGVSLERDVPGVTYDALGAHAAMAVYWKRQDPKHWRDQMALRKPALIIFEYGTNESDLWKIDWADYERDLGAVLDTLAAAAPNASILVLSPLDRAERGAGGELQTKPVILQIRDVERRVALGRHFAFWDTFTAMGGRGSMARWVNARPQLGGGDLTHPTPAGSEVLGNLLSKALIGGYEAWASAHP